MFGAREQFEWLDQVQADQGITRAYINVALALLRFANRERGDAFPSQETIARRAGAGEKTVKRAIAELVARGHLKRVQSTGRGYTNRYNFVLQRGPDEGPFSYRNGDKIDPLIKTERGSPVAERGSTTAGKGAKNDLQNHSSNHFRTGNFGMKKEEPFIDPHTAPDAADRQTAMCRAFKSVGFWHPDWGPEPGKAGCKIPAKILKQFELDPLDKQDEHRARNLEAGGA